MLCMLYSYVPHVCVLAAISSHQDACRAIAYEKFGRWFDAEEPLLRAKERTDAGSSALRHPRSELIAPLPQEVEPAFNNRKLHMRLPCDPGPGSGHLFKITVSLGPVCKLEIS